MSVGHLAEKANIQNRLISVALFFMFVTSGFGAIIPSAHTSGAGEMNKGSSTWYVDDDAAWGGDGSQDHPFQTIHEGIYVAETGDTVRVFNGTYPSVVITKSISLVGNSSKDTFLVAHDNPGYVIHVGEDYVNISGFLVTNASVGIEVQANHTIISGVNVTGNRDGIILDNAIQFVTIMDSVVNGSERYGIHVPEVSNITISNTTLSENYQGIYSRDQSTDILVRDSHFRDNQNGIDLTYGSRWTVSNSTFSSNYYAIRNSHLTGQVIVEDNILTDSNHAFSMIAMDEGRPIIRNNTIIGCYRGIYFWDVDSARVSGNTLLDCPYSIYLDEITSATFSGNTVTDARYGVYMIDSHETTLEGNNVSNTTDTSLLHGSSTSTTLLNSSFSNASLEFYGDELEHWVTHTVENTTMDGLPLVYLKNLTVGSFSGSAGQIILVNATNYTVSDIPAAPHLQVTAAYCHNVTLSNLNCSNTTISGIYLYQTTESTLTNITANSNDDHGVSLAGSDENTVIYVQAEGNGDAGIKLTSSDETTISRSSFIRNSNYGMNIWQGSGTTVEHSSISDQFGGIYLRSNDDTTFSNCSLANHTNSGMYVDTNNFDTIVTGCTIQNNSLYGVWVHPSYGEVDARNCWWGNESGPYHEETNPEGTGDTVTDKVDYYPWTGFGPGGEVHGPILYVDDDAPIHGNGSMERPFQSIGDALEEAEDGYTIRVFDGTYEEKPIIDRQVTIIGNSSDTTHIRGDGKGDVILITSANVTILGLSVVNSGTMSYDELIRIDADNATISSCHLEESGYNGIISYGYDNITISGVTIDGGGRYGIAIRGGSRNISISECVISGIEYGIFLESVVNVSVAGCSLIDLGSYAIDVTQSEDIRIMNSVCENTDSYGIRVASSSNVTILNNTIRDVRNGIHVTSCPGARVSGNNCTGNLYGLIIQSSSHESLVIGNTLNRNLEYGVGIIESDAVMIRENTIHTNSQYGIRIFTNSNGCSIIGNSIRQNSIGVTLYQVNSTLIQDNEIRDNSNTGIDTIYSCFFTEVHGNNIVGNRVFGARQSEPVEMNATGNWWGNESGPFHAQYNPNGTGDTISYNMVFDPWLTWPAGDFLRWYVDDDAPDGGNGSHEYPFNSIQEALNHSRDNHTIYVYEGTYHEQIMVNASVTIIGNGSDESIILWDEGEDEGSSVVAIQAPGCSLSGFSILNRTDGRGGTREGGGKGIGGRGRRGESDSTRSESSEAQGPETAIFSSGHNSTISQVTITGFQYGILFEGANDSSIRHNTISGANDSGIKVVGSDRSTVAHNTIRDGNQYGIYLYGSDFSTVGWNTVLNNSKDGIYLIWSESSHILGNTCSWNKENGIYLWSFTHEAFIESNRLEENGNGILLSGAPYSRLEHNILVNNQYGIVNRASPYNQLSWNTVMGNDIGIYLQASDYVSVGNCTISRNDIGIFMYDISANGYTVGTEIHLNNIFTNSDAGIDNTNNGGRSVNATGNWWGSDTGPYHPDTNAEGIGDKVTDHVEYWKWLYWPFDEPWTWYVDDDASGMEDGSKEDPFSTIQDAIDAARVGDIVSVFNGTYHGMITINKELFIVGNGSADTTIQGSGIGEIVRIQEPFASFSGFNLNGSAGDAYGVRVYSDNASVRDCIISNVTTGIRLDSSDGSTVQNITIADEIASGIALYTSHENLIKGNTGSVFLSSSNRNLIQENYAPGDHEIHVYQSYDNVVRDNICIDNTEQYRCGIKIDRSHRTLVEGNTLAGNDYNIHLVYSANNIIRNNNCTDTIWNIYLQMANSNSLDTNICSGVRYGFRLYHSSDNIFTENQLTAIGHSAIYLGMGCDRNLIIDSEFTRSSSYLYVEGSEENAYNVDNEVHNSNFAADMTYGIRVVNNGGNEVNATGNWWGHESGPEHDSNPGGEGCSVTDDVIFDPWLTRPANTALTLFVAEHGSDQTGDGSAVNPFRTILHAFGEAAAGDTIKVYNGTYEEQLVLTTSITLQGNGSSTIIDGGNGDGVIWVEVDGVTISGMHIKNATDGIIVHGNRSTIRDNTFSGIFHSEIWLEKSKENIIDSNLFLSTGYRAIFLHGSSYTTIINNRCISASDRGIYLIEGSDWNLLQDNIVMNCTFRGISLQSSSNNTITGNMCTNNTLSGISLEGDSSWNIISSNICAGNDLGIYLMATSSTTITDSIFIGNREDLMLSHSSDVNIVNTHLDVMNFTDAESDVSVWWTFDLAVLSSLTSSPLPWADVRIADGHNTTVCTSQTNSNGRLPLLPLLEFSDNGTLRNTSNPYTLFIGKKGYHNHTSEFILDNLTEMEITLEKYWPPYAVIAGQTFQHASMDSVFQFNASLSTGYNLTYSWDFGNGNATLPSPTPLANHTYPKCGEYLVELTVTDGYGAISRANITLMVENVLPTAVANASTYQADEDEPILFYGSNSTDTPSDTLTFLWDFGDGNTSLSPIANHAYLRQGNYTVNLTVTDENGGRVDRSLLIHVRNVAPWITTGDIPPDAFVGVTTDMGFKAEDSTDDIGTLHYHWNFSHEDGNLDIHFDTSNISYAFMKPGEYKMTISVTDKDGSSTSQWEHFYVGYSDVDLEMRIQGGFYTDENGTIFVLMDEQHTFSIVHPNDDGNFTYNWSLRFNTIEMESWRDRNVVNYSFREPGSYQLIISVEGYYMDESWQFDFHVYNTPPTADAGPDIDRHGPLGVPITFSASNSTDTPSDIDSLNYTWAIEEYLYYGEEVRHTFDEPGNYTIRLFVRDRHGAESNATINIVIAPLAEPINGSGPNICLILLILLIVLLVILFFVRGGRPTPVPIGDEKTTGTEITSHPSLGEEGKKMDETALHETFKPPDEVGTEIAAEDGSDPEDDNLGSEESLPETGEEEIEIADDDTQVDMEHDELEVVEEEESMTVDFIEESGEGPKGGEGGVSEAEIPERGGSGKGT